MRDLAVWTAATWLTLMLDYAAFRSRVYLGPPALTHLVTESSFEDYM